MAGKLWSWEELATASGGASHGTPSAVISGLSIDTRSLLPGDAFVALSDTRDGHAFVPAAFAQGAAAAIVAETYEKHASDGALLRVRSPLDALHAIGAAARTRSVARIVAVTGSVGKTSTKEALRLCLSQLGSTHAAEKSFNNHWGVPLTLARMPAETRFGVIEIGMNHAGEISPLSKIARPHVAVITTIEPVHLEHFANVQEIAAAKAEIFCGLEPGGTAVLNRDNPHFAFLAETAAASGARVRSFGTSPDADVVLKSLVVEPHGSDVVAVTSRNHYAYRLGAPGAHIAINSLAIVATLEAMDVDVGVALASLADMSALPGRGARHKLEAHGGHVLLIDESYNANPASMRAAISLMAVLPRHEYPRRIAVLGDMLELGQTGPQLHIDLAESIDAAAVDLVFACGPLMKSLFETLPRTRQGAWAMTSEGIVDALLTTVAGGDAVVVKGSLGSRMAPLVSALQLKFNDRVPV